MAAAASFLCLKPALLKKNRSVFAKTATVYFFLSPHGVLRRFFFFWFFSSSSRKEEEKNTPPSFHYGWISCRTRDTVAIPIPNALAILPKDNPCRYRRQICSLRSSFALRLAAADLRAAVRVLHPVAAAMSLSDLP